MPPTTLVEIIDKDGWGRTYPLEKAIAYLGSDPRNEIALDPRHSAGGIAPRHLQIICLGRQMCRLVNLSESELAYGQGGAQRLAPRAYLDVTAGERLQLGDLSLIIRPGDLAADGLSSGGAAAAPGAGAIGLKLLLPSPLLTPDRLLAGVVVVRNQGAKTGAQFRLEVEGLESDCYEIGPGPILFPNAEKEVALELRHPHRPQPPAGDLRLTVRASAPAAYPGESASVAQTLQVLPFRQHSLRVVVPG